LYTEQHEWITVDGKIGTVGASNYAQVQGQSQCVLWNIVVLVYVIDTVTGFITTQCYASVINAVALQLHPSADLSQTLINIKDLLMKNYSLYQTGKCKIIIIIAKWLNTTTG